jgi:HSP20 family protein
VARNNMTRSNPRGAMVRPVPYPDIGNLLRGLSIAPVLRELEQAPRMKVDIDENDQAYILRADVPGADREDITVTVDGNTVSIVADVMQERTDPNSNGNMILSERVYGEEYRVFTLPQEVDEAKAEARIDNGVLVLTLPKKTGSSATKLDIQSDASSASPQGQSASGSPQGQAANAAGQGQSVSGSGPATSAGDAKQAQAASGSGQPKSSS